MMGEHDLVRARQPVIIVSTVDFLRFGLAVKVRNSTDLGNSLHLPFHFLL